MSWHPNDLMTDADLVAYERTILTQFGVSDWVERRTKTLEDWLWPILETQGLDRARFRTRFAPDAVYGYTSAAYTNYTGYAQSKTVADVPLATILATYSTDALYLGSTQQFRGFSWRLSTVGTGTSRVTVALSCDEWRSVPVEDYTIGTAGKTLSRGGPMTWKLPDGWVPTLVNSVGPYYWAKVTVSATPTAAVASQIGLIRRSRLCGPVTLRTLSLIFREAPTAQDGPWREKADWYERAADETLQRVMSSLGGEFDTETEDDLIDSSEAGQTTAEASTTGVWRLERG